MTTKTKKWLHGLGSAVITGLSTSGLSALGVQGAQAVGVNVASLNLSQMGVIALVGGAIGAMAYLKQSPLPEMTTGDTEQFTKRTDQ